MRKSFFHGTTPQNEKIWFRKWKRSIRNCFPVLIHGAQLHSDDDTMCVCVCCRSYMKWHCHSIRWFVIRTVWLTAGVVSSTKLSRLLILLKLYKAHLSFEPIQMLQPFRFSAFQSLVALIDKMPYKCLFFFLHFFKSIVLICCLFFFWFICIAIHRGVQTKCSCKQSIIAMLVYMMECVIWLRLRLRSNILTFWLCIEIKTFGLWKLRFFLHTHRRFLYKQISIKTKTKSFQ